MKTKVTKNQTASVGKYSYQYVDIAQIHEYLEANNMSYYQYIDRIDGDIHRRHGMPCSDVVDPCAVVCLDINHPVPELCAHELFLSYFNVRATLPCISLER